MESEVKPLYDLYSRFKPLEERVELSLEDCIDDYSIINNISNNNPNITDSLTVIMDNFNFLIYDAIPIARAYRVFSTTWWREIIQKRPPNKELIPHYLIYIIIRENNALLLDQRKDEMRIYLKKDLNNEIKHLHTSLAYNEFNLSFEVPNDLSEKLRKKAVRNIKKVKPFPNDGVAELILLEKRQNYLHYYSTTFK